MSPETRPIANLTDAALQALLSRAMRDTLILGLLLTVALLFASGWRNAGMLATGAVISAASIFEWQRLIRLFNAKLDQQKTPRGAVTVITFFLLRLLIFAALIYVSLKCFRGSPITLLCGLGLALIAVAWQAFRLLKE